VPQSAPRPPDQDLETQTTTPSHEAARLTRWQGALHPGVTQVALILLLLTALLAGILASISVLAGVILVGVLSAVGILALGRQVIPVFHGGLLVILVGYAFIGKGFAYLGAPPLYVGEITLALCLAAIIWSIGRARLGLLHALLVMFMAWGAIRTIPYIGTYNIDALRDGATWVYGFFAIGVSLTVRPEHLGRLATGYRRLIPLFLLWVPIMAGLTFVAGNALPNTPGSNVPLLVFKAGDSAVQLAGVAAFILLGLYNQTGAASAARELVLWGMWLVGAGLTAALNRAGFIALFAISAVALFVRASSRWISLVAVGMLLVILATFLDPTVEIGGPRAISVDQVVSNVTSVFSSKPGTESQATKDWRVRWWNTIVDYTVNGPYFWTGKGFGINLADADGFQVLSDDSLRAPHSTHLEILARAGVPGLLLWLAFQIGFAVSLLRAAFRSYRTAPAWLPVLGWVFVYWLAAIIDGSFDVYLGGPQGGIWFWSVIGLGIAAIRLSAEEPHLDLSGRSRREAEDGPAIGRFRPALATAAPSAAIMGAAHATPAVRGFAPPAGLPPTGTPPIVAPPTSPSGGPPAPDPTPAAGPPAPAEPTETAGLDEADAAASERTAAPAPKTTAKRGGVTRRKRTSPKATTGASGSGATAGVAKTTTRSKEATPPDATAGPAGRAAVSTPAVKPSAKGATAAPATASADPTGKVLAKQGVTAPTKAPAEASATVPTKAPAGATTPSTAKPTTAKPAATPRSAATKPKAPQPSSKPAPRTRGADRSSSDG
jgi:hypothetical protein